MTGSQPSTLLVGTRTSRLAVWQTDHVVGQLQERWPSLSFETRTLVTKGDKALEKPLPEIEGKGLFTSELENALREGKIDIAVHSLKDLPVEDADGLSLGAIVGRADVRDVLVARNDWSLGTLPEGAVLGTSSLRRQVQLLARRPDLRVQSIRGNVDTRIRKVQDGQYDATVLAAAGVTRLGLDEHVTDWLPLEVMLPAPGQGALAVQCRADDARVLSLLSRIDSQEVRSCVAAERSFLHHLGGGCGLPVAAYAAIEGRELRLQGLVASPDGQQRVGVVDTGAAPEQLGAQLAKRALEQAEDAAGWLRQCQ